MRLLSQLQGRFQPHSLYHNFVGDLCRAGLPCHDEFPKFHRHGTEPMPYKDEFPNFIGMGQSPCPTKTNFQISSAWDKAHALQRRISKFHRHGTEPMPYKDEFPNFIGMGQSPCPTKPNNKLLSKVTFGQFGGKIRGFLKIG